MCALCDRFKARCTSHSACDLSVWDLMKSWLDDYSSLKLLDTPMFMSM